MVLDDLRLDHTEGLEDGAEHTETSENADNNDVDNEVAELRAGEVAEIDIMRHECEANTDNPTDDRDSEEEFVAEIAPHTDGFILGRDRKIVLCARGGSDVFRFAGRFLGASFARRFRSGFGGH